MINKFIASSPGCQSTRRAAIVVVALAALATGACNTRRGADVTASIAPNDVRDRHPIVLAEAPHSLELYPGPGGRLDARQDDDLAAFAAAYRADGRSVIIAEAPANGAHVMPGLYAALARHGLSGGNVQVRRYAAPHYSTAAPVRLSFARLQARVPHECGRWPEDLGVSNLSFNAANRPFWNLGCATQANLAAQVADPLDLVRSRAEGRIDTIKRTNNIEKMRKSEDPSTVYRSEATRLNTTVGN